jgi:hypothetical protein
VITVIERQMTEIKNPLNQPTRHKPHGISMQWREKHKKSLMLILFRDRKCLVIFQKRQARLEIDGIRTSSGV